jgi:hypothetical protein
VKKAYTYIPNLEDKGFILSIEKGKYLLPGFGSERVLSNPFFIASHIVYPSYVLERLELLRFHRAGLNRSLFCFYKKKGKSGVQWLQVQICTGESREVFRLQEGKDK